MAYQNNPDIYAALASLDQFEEEQNQLVQNPASSGLGLYSIYTPEQRQSIVEGGPLSEGQEAFTGPEYMEDRGWVSGGMTGAGYAGDFTAHGLWNLADTATFGLLDILNLDDWLWGEDYEVRSMRGDFGGDPAQTWGGGLGGFAGIITPGGPLRVAGALTKGVKAIPATMKLGRTAKSLTGTKNIGNLSKWDKSLTGLPNNVKLTDKAVEANKILYHETKALAQGAKTWGTKKFFARSENFAGRISSKVDEIVEANIRNGVWDPELASKISKIYKNLYNKRPVWDFTDLITKWMPGRFGYGIGSSLDEAFLFGTMDGILELVEAGERWGKGEGWHYDWAHPIWGTITGGLFGTLKWLPKGGKATSSQKDFQQGLRTYLGMAPKRIAAKSEYELKKYIEHQGNILKKSNEHILFKSKVDGKSLSEKGYDYSFKYKGSIYEVDLTNPKASMLSILKGSNLDDTIANREVIYKALATHMDRTIGKKAMGSIFTNSSLNWTSFSENWHRMVGGAVFMNAHTLYDYYQNDVPMDPHSVVQSILLGAYVQRKGVPRRIDFVPETMREVRWYMKSAGIETQNLHIDFPSFDSRYLEPNINPLSQDYRLLKVTEFAEKKLDMTTNDWRDHSDLSFAVADNIAISNHPDKALFLEFYSYLTGGSGVEKTYTMPLETITEADALRVVKRLKAEGINDRAQFQQIADRALNNGQKALNDAIISGAVDIRDLKINDISLPGLNSRSSKQGDLGEFSVDFVPEQRLLDKARRGEIEGIGKGDNAVEIVMNISKKANAISNYVFKLGRGQKSSNNPQIYIEKSSDFLNLKKTIEAREAEINKDFKLTRDLNKFSFDSPSLNDLINISIVRSFKQDAGNIQKMFHKDHPEFRDLIKVLSESGIIKFNPDKVKWEIPEKLNDIKFNTDDWENIKKDENTNARLRAVLKFARNIIALGGGADFVISKDKRFTSKQRVEDLATYLNERGINTNNPRVLNELHDHLVWTMNRAKAEGSSLKQNDLVLLSNLVNPSVRRGDRLHPMVRFSGVKGRDIPGWVIDLIDIGKLGDITNTDIKGLRKIAEEYNQWALDMIKNGETLEGLQLVKEGERITVVDEMNIRSIQAAMDMAKIYSSEKATKSLFEFFSVVEGKSTVRDALANLSAESMESKLSVLKMLYDFGVIKVVPISTEKQIKAEGIRTKEQEKKTEELKEDLPDVKQGFIEHDITFNREAWLKPENIVKFKDFINNEGINLRSIEEMHAEMHSQMEGLIESAYTPSENSKITQQDFFRTYFPVSYEKGGLSTPESRSLWLKQVMFNNGIFRGEKAYDEVFRKMEEQGTLNEKNADSIYDHVTQMFSNYIESRPVDVLFYSHGDIHKKTVSSSIYKSGFTDLMDRLDLNWGFIEGTYVNPRWNDNMRSVYTEIIDIYKADSNKLSKQEQAALKEARSYFEGRLDKFTLSNNEGIVDIAIPGKDQGNRIYVSKGEFSKIQTAFEAMVKEIRPDIDALRPEEAAIVNRKIEKILNDMSNQVIDSGTWKPAHTEALRALWFHGMLKGRNLKGDNVNKIVDYLKLSKGDPDITKLDTRFNLFSRFKFKRFNKELLDAQLNHMYRKEDGTTLERNSFTNEVRDRYRNTDGFNAIVWNDAVDARPGMDTSIKQEFDRIMVDNNIRNKHGQRITWDMISNSKGDETGFDSITWASKEFMRLNALQFGNSTHDGQIFKAHIASGGDHIAFFGKTVLVYSESLQKTLFNDNPALDVVFTASADKLNIMRDANNFVNVPYHQLGNAGDVSANTFRLPWESIGISKSPDHNSYAKVSVSFFNNDMSSKHNHQIFESMSREFFDKASNRLNQIVGRPLAESEAIRIIKKLDMENVDEYFNQGGSSGGYGTFLDWVMSSEFARPSALGREPVMKILKERFLDEALSPESYFEGTSGRLQFGAKSVLVQHPDTKLYDLAPTVIDSDGSIKQYGQMVAPKHVGEMPIDYEGRDSGVYLVTKNNKIVRAKDHFMALQDKMKELDPEGFTSDAKTEWSKLVNSDRPLESLHEYFSDLRKADELAVIFPGISEYFGDIVVAASRFPRTRPNDLALLRIKGFLEFGGNQAIVNKFDVYNIFEGDYDVDMIDYFWGMPTGMVDHIQKQHRNWVSSPNMKLLNPAPHARLELLSMNPGENAKEWNIFDSNKRVFKNMIGTVQATTAQVNHIADVAEKRVDKVAGPEGKVEEVTRRILLEGKHDGRDYRVEVDWDNADWFQRQALEAQAIIDFSNGVDPSITAGGTRNYRDNYLFPLISESVGLEHYESNMNKFNNNLHNRKNGGGDRIRLFRRYEKVDGEWVERDLLEIDRDIIKIQMREHNKILNMMPGRKINFDGQRRAPGYTNIIDAASAYFNHTRNLNNSLYGKLTYLKNEQGYPKYDRDAGELHDYFGGAPTLNKVGKSIQRKNPEADVGGYYYTWRNKDPFTNTVRGNYASRSNPDGQQGNFAERSLKEIWMNDHLNIDRDMHILTGKEFLEYEMIEHMMFNEGPVSELTLAFPTIKKNIRNAKSHLLRLKKSWVKVQYSKLRPERKKEVQDAINEQIRKLENSAEIKTIMTADYKKSKKFKDLGDIEQVDIQSNHDYLEGTTQFYTTAALFNQLTRMNKEGNFVDITSTETNRIKAAVAEFKKEVGINYSHKNFDDLYAFGRNTLHNSQQLDRLGEGVPKTGPEIEIDLMNKITERVINDELGFGFLYVLARPKTNSITNKVGIFKGKALPVATQPTTNYKRALRWLTMASRGEFNIPHELQMEARGVRDKWAELDWMWYNFLNAKKGLADMPSQSLTSFYGTTSNSIPDFNYQLNTLFNNYNSVKIGYDKTMASPFGMGHNYSKKMTFLRSLLTISGIGNEDVTGLAKTFSYTAQLMMENRYMNPLRYHTIMSNIAPMINGALSKVTPEGSKIPWLSELATDRMNYVVNDMQSGNVGLNTQTMFTPHDLSMMKKMSEQVDNIRETDTDTWGQIKSEMQVTPKRKC